MNALNSLRKISVAAIIAAGLKYRSRKTTSTSDCSHWKTVIVYVSVTKPHTFYITNYDQGGKPFRFAKIGYKTLQIPIKKQFKVCF